jgi:hypothetical protein
MDQTMQGMPPFSQGLDGPSMDNNHMRHDNMQDDGEDLIPTAIVIKNIPFAVKKEQLVQVMTDLGLPLPYAFNYHFDQGVFRGLAFANFTSPEETAVVIQALNHYELHGRKLRVEYKKMLPQAERERIEREKRIKRGQLEEQHRPLQGAQLQTQSSFSSLASQLPTSSPSPVSSRPLRAPGLTLQDPLPPMSSFPPDVNFNDPVILDLYSQILIFKQDLSRDTLILAPTLTPPQRRVVHTIAHHFHLTHVSKGSGDQRAVHIYRYPDGANISPPIADFPTNHPVDSHRRPLARAATTDLSEHRDGFQYGTLGRQSSGLLAGFPDSPGFHNSHLLRTAKSVAELRSISPSPVPSTASYPANHNISRLQELAGTTTGASNPNLTSTTLAPRDENMLVNGMSTMSLGGFGPSGSPRSTRNIWGGAEPGPIGSNRAFSSTTLSLDEQRGGQAQPQRQPRGPTVSGFPRRAGESRHNEHSSGRGSDEISSQPGVEILVEQ